MGTWLGPICAEGSQAPNLSKIEVCAKIMGKVRLKEAHRGSGWAKEGKRRGGWVALRRSKIVMVAEGAPCSSGADI